MAEILLPEFQLATVTGSPSLLLGPQFHPAYLAGDGFRQVAELDPPDTFIGCQLLTGERDDVAGQFRARGMAMAQDDKGLGNT